MAPDRNRTYRLLEFTLDTAAYQLRRDTEIVHLERRPMDLLILLVERRGQLVSRDEIVSRLWGDEVFVEVDAGIHTAIRKIRRVLNDSVEAPRFIETTPGKGYRFIAELQAALPPRQTRHADRLPGLRYFRPALAAALVASVAVAAVWWTVRAVAPLAPPRTLAVLPLKPLVADARDEALELGLTDSLIDQVSQLREIKVSPLSAVRRYGGTEQDPLAAGRALGVDTVLDGHFQRSGDVTRFTLRLLDVRDGSTRWADRAEAPNGDLLTLQDLVATRVADGLAMTLTSEERKRIARPRTTSVDAYLAYARGRYHLWRRTQRDNRRALQFFEEAITHDARYAQAYAGLSDAYAALAGQLSAKPHDVMPTAREMALRALALDDSLAEAHTALANVHAQYEYDYAAAEKAHRRAIALNPRGFGDLYWYGHTLRSAGRFEEALSIFQRARQVDPLSPEVHRGIAHVHFASRQMDQAIQQSLPVLDLDPNYPGAYYVLSRAYEAKGMHDQSIAALLKMWSLEAGTKEADLQKYRDAYTAHGWLGFWRLYRESLHPLAPPFQVAEILMRLGETEEALRKLDEAVEERSGYLHQLATNPIWDGVRADNRFRVILSRVVAERGRVATSGNLTR